MRGWNLRDFGRRARGWSSVSAWPPVRATGWGTGRGGLHSRERVQVSIRETRAACCRRRTVVVCPGPVRKEFEQAVALDVLFLVRELAGPIEVSSVQPFMPERANGRL